MNVSTSIFIISATAALALVSIMARAGALLDRRIQALEQRQAQGVSAYLYVLNERGNWDRVRDSTLAICQTKPCSVFIPSINQATSEAHK